MDAQASELTTILCIVLLVAWVVAGAVGLYRVLAGPRQQGYAVLAVALLLAIVWVVVC